MRGRHVIGVGVLTAFAFAACSGERQPQSASCARYVRCVRALDAAQGLSTDTVRFEPQGDCWGGEAGARLCSDSCSKALDELPRRWGSVPAECRP